MDYKARLKQILEKRNKGETLNIQDTEDFAKIQRMIKTKDFKSYCHAIRPDYKWTWFQEYIQDKTTEKFNKKNGRIICKMPQQHGKAARNGSLVKTANGWHPIESLKVGDIVDNACGKYTEVIGVYPQGIKDIYRITFEDGRYSDCCENHLWQIYSTRFKKIREHRVVNIKELIRLLSCKMYKNNLYIPRYVPLVEKDIILPIEPYLLGVMLGDGSFSKTIKLTWPTKNEKNTSSPETV